MKTRTGDDEGLVSELDDTGQAYRHEPLGVDSPIGRVLHDADKQLSSTAKPGCEEFRVIFLLCTSRYQSDSEMDLVVATLFGREKVLDYEDLGRGWTECYFLRESFFFSHQQVDATVAMNWESKRYVLAVNSYSGRYGRFQGSAMYRHSDEIRVKSGALAILDPPELENLGRAFLVDCAIPRKDHVAVMAYVKEKYALKAPQSLVLGHHSSFVSVPRTPSDHGSDS